MAGVPSLKQLQIDKATSNMAVAVSIATFVVIFCLVAGHTLLGVLSYQNRVVSAQSRAVDQLNQDLTARQNLLSSYQNFEDTTTNILGSPTTGSGQNNGDNAKVVLDALPYQYDVPALASSLQFLLSNQGVTISGISGTDNGTAAVSTGTVPIPMNFTFSIQGPYQNVQNAIANIKKSILPIQLQTLNFTGNQSNMTVNVTGQAYYLPATTFNITKETIK